MWNNNLRITLDNMSMFIDMNHLTIDRSRDQGCGVFKLILFHITIDNFIIVSSVFFAEYLE